MKPAAQSGNIGPVTDHSRNTDAEIIRDLARAKAVFQMRAIEAIIKGGGR